LTHSIIPTPPAPVLLVDEREAARLLGVSPRSLWNFEKQGLVKSVRLGKSKRYSLRDLEDAIERLRTK
jgi:DNA-binding transcriptional MerR regulator